MANGWIEFKLNRRKRNAILCAKKSRFNAATTLLIFYIFSCIVGEKNRAYACHAPLRPIYNAGKRQYVSCNAWEPDCPAGSFCQMATFDWKTRLQINIDFNLFLCCADEVVFKNSNAASIVVPTPPTVSGQPHPTPPPFYQSPAPNHQNPVPILHNEVYQTTPSPPRPAPPPESNVARHSEDPWHQHASGTGNGGNPNVPKTRQDMNFNQNPNFSANGPNLNPNLNANPNFNPNQNPNSNPNLNFNQNPNPNSNVNPNQNPNINPNPNPGAPNPNLNVNQNFNLNQLPNFPNPDFPNPNPNPLNPNSVSGGFGPGGSGGPGFGTGGPGFGTGGPGFGTSGPGFGSGGPGFGSGGPGFGTTRPPDVHEFPPTTPNPFPVQEQPQPQTSHVINQIIPKPILNPAPVSKTPILPPQAQIMLPGNGNKIVDGPQVIQLVVGEVNHKGTDGMYKYTGSVSLVQDGGLNILVDSGSAQNRLKLLAALAQQGIKPQNIQLIVYTHAHPDHMGNDNLFPYAQKLYSTTVFKGDEYMPLQLMQEPTMRLTQNVEIWQTPGHTYQHNSVIVRNIASEGSVALAGDLFMSEEDLHNPGIWQSVSVDKEVQEQMRHTIMCQVDFIIPGHGGPFRVKAEDKKSSGCTARKRAYFRSRRVRNKLVRARDSAH